MNGEQTRTVAGKSRKGFYVSVRINENALGKSHEGFCVNGAQTRTIMGNSRRDLP